MRKKTKIHAKEIKRKIRKKTKIIKKKIRKKKTKLPKKWLNMIRRSTKWIIKWSAKSASNNSQRTTAAQKSSKYVWCAVSPISSSIVLNLKSKRRRISNNKTLLSLTIKKNKCLWRIIMTSLWLVLKNIILACKGFYVKRSLSNRWNPIEVIKRKF